MASSKQLHVVAVPLPVQGHLNPLMRFCTLLASSHDVLVTFVTIDPVHRRIEELALQQKANEVVEKEAAAASKQDGHGQKGSIRRAHVPMQDLDLANSTPGSSKPFFEALSGIASPLEALILELNQQGPPVTCLISDIAMTSATQDVADRLNIPRSAVFVPYSASGFLLVHYIIQGHIHISLQEVLARLSRRESKREAICEGLPGLPTVYNDEAFYFKHKADDNAYMWESMKGRHDKAFCRGHAVVFNTFTELEELALTALANQLDLPIYRVGPLTDTLHKGCSTSLWKENDTCLQWLDQQPHLSVLYISFGSITLLTQVQVEEILSGLVNCKQRFLWVVRPDLVENMPYSVFSSSILSRSHGKGYVVDWAPQCRVLSHPSLGGFLTHCGWNSTIEAISHGVPMLCWPYFADQFLNAKYIVNIWKVGLYFEASKESSCSLVESHEVERIIKVLMEGEEGRSLRKNALHLKEASFASLLQGGSSYHDIQALIKSLVI